MELVKGEYNPADLRDKKGRSALYLDNKTGERLKGSIRIREVRCGKPNCKKCPHKVYAYLRYRQGRHVKEKYLGVARGIKTKKQFDKYDPEKIGKGIAGIAEEIFKKSEKADSDLR